MGLFDGLNNAQTFERGDYFLPGRYVLCVKKFLAKETLRAGTCTIVEFDIIESDRPEMPKGSRGTWIQKMDKKPIALAAIKAFALAVFGIEQGDAVNAAALTPHLENIVNKAVNNPDNNDFTNRCVRLHANLIKTQKGTDFTRMDFSPYREEAKS